MRFQKVVLLSLRFSKIASPQGAAGHSDRKRKLIWLAHLFQIFGQSPDYYKLAHRSQTFWRDDVAIRVHASHW